MTGTPPPFAAPFAPPDEALLPALAEAAAAPPGADARIDAEARALVAAIRAGGGGIGGVEDVLRAYSLSTDEGLALMALAEALLRIGDPETADRFVEDKLSRGDWDRPRPPGDPLLVEASAWALGVAASVVRPGATPESVLRGAVRRIGLPAVRTAVRRAVKVMGAHFVLGETIEAALRRAREEGRHGVRHSFDMLGEGARTAEDAERYRRSYADAIEAIGRQAGNRPQPDRPGISVKLSALHPRYEPLSRGRVMAELVPVVLGLAERARDLDLGFTVDAEEADRLELSLDVVGAVLASPTLAGWDGFGLAVQAYQKRAPAVIDHVRALADALDRRITVRLVKGAYWDTEVKRAQERGLDGFPVWTRKAATDVAYVACARRLLDARGRIFPQFATHNALTVATVIELAGGTEGYEFQRLHGMGEALYRGLRERRPDAAVRVYAPVGGHADLLAYLVRRLLENGANSSFVAAAADPEVPPGELLERPQARLAAQGPRNPAIRAPRELFGPHRPNSAGVEFGSRLALDALLADVAAAAGSGATAAPVVDGRRLPGEVRPVVSPCDGRTAVGRVVEADPAAVAAAVEAADRGFPAWDATPAATRAAALRRTADLIEGRRGLLIALLQAEAGKTLDDALAEVREAADFCRYYAVEAERLFGADEALPGPAGEDNRLRLRGRGVFAAIAPWNFPLAIFVGQAAAALAAGNAVVAKPAPQTPLVAAEAVRMLHEAGVPASALHLVPGGPETGASLVAHPRIAGVAFTGSTATARRINRALAEKDGPIVPLIAETGGINAMIADATALPEQVADDVVASAFRSAGQRCSALRLLCVQDDAADRIVAMVRGAAAELAVGDPRDPAVHVGPVIDAQAKRRLDAHLDAMAAAGRVVWRGRAPAEGTYVAPAIVRLDRVEDLGEEHFGPVLHVVRWAPERFADVLEGVRRSGYGLTLGVHTRIDRVVREVVAALPVGNVYVNRNMVGAVVGSQPFGGSGLSGTGPKAGGPHYLARFALEQTVSVNTAAAGGNASLLAMSDPG
jgi:RHH-type proline utilization regulon transcriptional repressor/proline dehydrogenase/delta 1-pyrroline-5-carboxylate dehydrogenase